MYYKRYFSGSLDSTTTTNQYYMGKDKVATGTQAASGHIKNRSDVIGNALVTTLKAVGFSNAYWDSTAGYLFFDKTNALAGIYISVQASYIYAAAGYVSSSYNYIYHMPFTSSASDYGCGQSVSASSSPFSTNNATACSYAFYVTIKGEPKGTFSIHLGTYNQHDTETSGLYFYVCLGKDKRDNSAIIGYNFRKTTTVYQFLITNKVNGTLIDTREFGMSNTTLQLLNETIVLISLFFKYGFIVLDNTYFNPGLSEGFYTIDGSTYQVCAYYMTKCITSV